MTDCVHVSRDSIGYDTGKRITTTIAEKELARFSVNGNTCVPEDFVHGRFLHFAADNLDVLEDTFDGRGTFHIIQMAAFQRGLPNEKKEKRQNQLAARSP